MDRDKVRMLICCDRLPGTNFSYILSFSNSSAKLTIMTYFNGSGMQLEFSGPRANNDSLSIELITSNPAQPQFQYIDGQAIAFSSSTSSAAMSTVLTSTTPMEPTLTQTSAPTLTSKAAAVHGHWPGNVAYGCIAGPTFTCLLLSLLG
jgi:hypothetical protein